jgi:membrane protease YdiL (CAAX protease family)
MPPEIPPYVPRHETLTVEKLYSRTVRGQVTKVVLITFAYLVIQLIASGIIEAVIIFASGAFGDIMRSATEMAQGGTIDMDGLAASTQDSAYDMVGKHFGIISIASAAAGLLIFLVLRGRRLFTTDITESRAAMSAPLLIKLWVIAMGAQLIFDVLANLLNAALGQAGYSATELMEQSIQMLETPSGLLYICLAGPIIEELAFRGAIMKSLERFGMNFAIFISALLFGLMHMFTVQAIFAFFMGLILGYIAGRYSLKWSILVHILINTAAMGISYLGAAGGTDTTTGQGVFAGLSLAILIVFLVCGTALLIKERWRFAEQKTVGAPIMAADSPPNTGALMWGAAFTSVPLIIYIVLMIGAGIITIIGLPWFTDIIAG